MPPDAHPDAASPSDPTPPAGGPRDAAVQVVLALVPEFLPDYAALADATGDDPGPVEVCAELASVTAGWLATRQDDDRVARVCRAIEQIASDPGAAVELVGLGFLDALEPHEQDGIRPILGPRTRAILDELDDVGL